MGCSRAQLSQYYTSRGHSEAEAAVLMSKRSSGAGEASRVALGPEGVKAQLRKINPNFRENPNFEEVQEKKRSKWTEEKRAEMADAMREKWRDPAYREVRSFERVPHANIV